MKFALILGAVMTVAAISHGRALASESVNDVALKMGAREALICFRQVQTSAGDYKADQLHRFAPCIENMDFGDETTSAEHVQTDMRHAAAYYLAVENFGRMTQRDYGTLGVSEMQYLTDSGKIALADLDARGFGSEQVCAILSWVECARFKALPRR